jgi:hypothetical protein
MWRTQLSSVKPAVQTGDSRHGKNFNRRPKPVSARFTPAATFTQQVFGELLFRISIL